MSPFRIALVCALLPLSSARAQVGLGTTVPSARLDIHHTSSFGSPTLNLYDLGSTNYSRLQFQNASGAKFWHIAGLLSNTDSLARLNVFHSTAGDVMSFTGAGRVGIGTTTPAQKLDVAGNMQISGAIMPAGNPGNMGQYLRSGGGGAMTWGDAGFKNQVVFSVPSFPGTTLNTTWTVPAGVSNVRVEMWSGGGHGGYSGGFDSVINTSSSVVRFFTGGGGGGGGAFCSASITVLPAQVLSLQIPAGGEGNSASVVSGTNAIYLLNGNDGNNAGGSGGQGGVFGGSTGTFTNISWAAGESGDYYQWEENSYGGSITFTSFDFGDGGAAAVHGSGGTGGRRILKRTDISTVYLDYVVRNGRNGGFPGGGGGGGEVAPLVSVPKRGLGAGGMIVIHY